MQPSLRILLICPLLTVAIVSAASAESIKVAVIQTAIEDTVEANRLKHLRFIEAADDAGCRLVVFPENSLYWSEYSANTPTRMQLDAAIESIRLAARTHAIHVAFGTADRQSETGRFRNHAIVFGPDGNRLVSYHKSVEVPPAFDVDGIPCCLVICSDRWYLEMSDLPCLINETKLIIDISGGHGADDGGPDLPMIRYRPWAVRTGAWVVVSNPVHTDTDFMGRTPWGGSAVIRPDGSVLQPRTHQPDVMHVAEVDPDLANHSAAARRRNHPLFRTFWDTGARLLRGESIETVAEAEPLPTTPRNVRIAVAQMACTLDMSKNIEQVGEFIRQAAREEAEVVVFPELALTGTRREDIEAAGQERLDSALEAIGHEARTHRVHVIVGTPFFANGVRYNGAVVIGDDGQIKTRHAQIVSRDTELFRGGTELGTMWFDLEGVPGIVTIGDDADWIEIGDLAATRGMSLHFHLSNESDASSEQTVLRRQRDLLALSYAQFGAVVNAAGATNQTGQHGRATGGSLIVSREGGHNQPAPSGIEYYLPYQTSIVRQGTTEESLLVATRRVAARNPMGVSHYKHRTRRSRPQHGWDDWIRQGELLIGP